MAWLALRMEATSEFFTPPSQPWVQKLHYSTPLLSTYPQKQEGRKILPDCAGPRSSALGAKRVSLKSVRKN